MSFYRKHAGAASPEWPKRDRDHSPTPSAGENAADAHNPTDDERDDLEEPDRDVRAPYQHHGRDESRAPSVIVIKKTESRIPTPHPSPHGSRKQSTARYRSLSPHRDQSPARSYSTSLSDDSPKKSNIQRVHGKCKKGRANRNHNESPRPARENVPEPVSDRSITSLPPRNELILQIAKDALDGGRGLRLEVRNDSWEIETFDPDSRQRPRKSRSLPTYLPNSFRPLDFQGYTTDAPVKEVSGGAQQAEIPGTNGVNREAENKRSKILREVMEKSFDFGREKQTLSKQRDPVRLTFSEPIVSYGSAGSVEDKVKRLKSSLAANEMSRKCIENEIEVLEGSFGSESSPTFASKRLFELTCTVDLARTTGAEDGS